MPKVLITGASSGLGLEIAKAFIEKDCVVVNLSRSNPDLNSLITISTDLSQNSEIEKAMEIIKSEHSDISLIVLNSGILLRREIGKYNNNEIDYGFSVNLSSMIKIVNCLIDIVRKNKGDIVIIGSSQSFQSYGDNSATYVAAKHGVLGFIRALQAELKNDDVRVIGVHPGGFKSQLHILAESKIQQELLMDPKYIAKMIVNIIELPRDMQVSEIIIHRKRKEYIYPIN